MRVRTANESDLPVLEDLIAESFDVGFDPRPVLCEKLLGPGFGGPARPRVVEEDEAIRGVAVTCGSSLRLLCVEPESRRRGLGSALLRDAGEEISVTPGRTVVAACPGNYLVPGIPEQETDAIGFFRNRGFVEISRSTDMIAPLGRWRRPENGDVSVERLTRFDEEVETFLVSEFGRAISWEIGHGLLSDRAIVRVARTAGSLAGFTAVEINNAGLGTFGPQGVRRDLRGRGIGRLLLIHSLADLSELGYGAARIPWVSSVEYYERTCGARVAGRYVVMRRD